MACNQTAMETCSIPPKQSKLSPTTFLLVVRKSILRTLALGPRPKCFMTSVLEPTLLVLPRTPHNIPALITVSQIVTLLALLVLLILPYLTAPRLGANANHMAPILAETRIALPGASNADTVSAKHKLLWLKGLNCLTTHAFVKSIFTTLGQFYQCHPCQGGVPLFPEL